ncbi:MAG: hypothetical protein AAGI63_03450 [Planctomycetota bacterium]
MTDKPMPPNNQRCLLFGLSSQDSSFSFEGAYGFAKDLTPKTVCVSFELTLPFLRGCFFGHRKEQVDHHFTNQTTSSDIWKSVSSIMMLLFPVIQTWMVR